MKKLLAVLLTFCAISATAEIYYDNSIYTRCKICVTEFDYREYVRSHFDQYSDLTGKPAQRYVVLGRTSFTVMRAWLQPQRNQSGRSFPRRLPTLVFDSVQIMVTSVTPSEEETNFYNQYLDPWRPAIGKVKPSRISNTPNLYSLRRINASFYNWLGITESIQSEINSTIADYQINPFYFAASALKLTFDTNNGHQVTVYNNSLTSEFSWEVAHYQNEYGRFDRFASSISIIETPLPDKLAVIEDKSNCFVDYFSDTCQSFSSSVGYYGDLYFYDRTELQHPPTKPTCPPGGGLCPTDE